MKYVKQILAMVLALTMLLAVSPMVLAAEHPFTDIPAGIWYESAAEYVYQNNLMGGTSASSFSPDLNMTRAMLVTVLYRLEGSPAGGDAIPFADVPADAYYHAAVVWAYENGIVSGTSASAFSPNSSISRQQMVTIFARYANYRGLKTPLNTSLSRYTDYLNVSPYARKAFSWAVGAGIIKGTSATELSPQDSVTRAQCAVILQRFIIWTQAKPILTPKPTTSPILKPTPSLIPKPTFKPRPTSIPVPTSVPDPTPVIMSAP